MLSTDVGTTTGQRTDTLRNCLQAAGFAAAANTPGGPELDRKLSSSECAATEDEFVAAFYYADELNGQLLGPLHLTLFDKRMRRWVNRPDIDAHLDRNGFERGGAALAIRIAKPFILIETHATPSANYQLLVDRQLLPVTSFCGYRSHVARDGSIFFHGCMVHFSPIHQERLFRFDFRTRRQQEIFPGAHLSPLARAFLREVTMAYRRLPAERQRAMENSAYGPVTAFDRSLPYLQVADNGRRLAAFVHYTADRLENPPTAESVAVCNAERGGWKCEERPLADVAAAYRIPLKRTDTGALENDQATVLLRRALRSWPARGPRAGSNQD